MKMLGPKYIGQKLEKTKFQVCRYKESEEDTAWKLGLACLHNSFDVYDIEYIINLLDGKKPKKVWDYSFIPGPMKCLDLNYQG